MQTLTDIELAYALISPLLPDNASLTIEATTNKLLYKYLFRAYYTSKSSGRTFCVLAKGNTLPFCDDQLLKYYSTQLILDRNQQRLEFSKRAYFEKQARQADFLFERPKENILVSTKAIKSDRLEYGTLHTNNKELQHESL